MPTQQEYEDAEANWDTMTDEEMKDEEKKDFVEDVITDTIEEYGCDSVQVNYGDVEEEGWYDYNDGSIWMDEEHVTEGDFYQVMETAWHESGHAINDQTSDYMWEEDELYGDELEDFADAIADEEMDENFPLPEGSSVPSDGDDFGNDLADSEEAGSSDDESSWLDDLCDFWDWLWGSG